MFTPGPTEVHPKVLKALSEPLINPDIDARFFEIYDSLVEKIQRVAGTKSTLFVMAGEGMVALDSAVANLVEPRDEVLSISSGVFGDGFTDLIKNYRAKPVVVRSGYDDIVTPSEVDRALEKNPKIGIATFVHCETPSGTISPLKDIGKVCNDHGVLMIADAVSTLAGVPVNADKNHIDVCLGASQKCFSAPPGLAIISVSERAWDRIERRKAKVQSFYLDLSSWKKMWLEERTFPYTQSASNIVALNASLDLILEEGLNSVYGRHTRIAEFIRTSCEEMGLELFPERREICSDTVTALKVPSGIDETKLRERMRIKHGVTIAGSWGKLEGRVMRLGHMGYNAQMAKAKRAVAALSQCLKSLQ
jgi:aspartate aminotransferase-like enzyme